MFGAAPMITGTMCQDMQNGGYFVALASALITVRVPGTSQGGGVRRGGLIGG
jgi:hypothetical protein